MHFFLFNIAVLYCKSFFICRIKKKQFCEELNGCCLVTVNVVAFIPRFFFNILYVKPISPLLTNAKHESRLKFFMCLFVTAFVISSSKNEHKGCLKCPPPLYKRNMDNSNTLLDNCCNQDWLDLITLERSIIICLMSFCLSVSITLHVYTV